MKNGWKKTATTKEPELDFTGLYRASTKLSDSGEYTFTTETKKEPTEPLQPNIEPNTVTFSEAQQTQAYEVYRAYQENIMKAQQIRSEILKGLDAGEPAEELLLKASEAISRMTGDAVFLELVKKKM